MRFQRKQSSGGKCSETVSPPIPAAPAKPQQRDLHLLILSSFDESFPSYFSLQRPLRAPTESSYKNKRQVAWILPFGGWRGRNPLARQCRLRFPSATSLGSWEAGPTAASVAGNALGRQNLGLAFKLISLASCCQLSVLPRASCSFSVTFAYVSSTVGWEQEKRWIRQWETLSTKPYWLYEAMESRNALISFIY